MAQCKPKVGLIFFPAFDWAITRITLSEKSGSSTRATRSLRKA